MSRSAFLVFFTVQVLSSASLASLPKRLILALDGISYRDMKALQEGINGSDSKGRPVHRQAFHEGYFPVSRLISTFPSASDVAWTEILGNRPLAGYQRTYYNMAANREIFVNGVTSTADYEKQMTWRLTSRFYLAMGYVHPLRVFRYEVGRLVEDFLNTASKEENYYALILSSDSAQHMGVDVFTMLCILDEKLQNLRARYKDREGRDLEILIISDHGNNHAGAGQRIQIRKFLKKAGYHLRESIMSSKDVVLPTAGIESWVELHNAPTETERLMELLSHLKGVDVLTAQIPGRVNQYMVMNSKGERASVEWDESKQAFRYTSVMGDPLQYLPVVDVLRRKGQLDAEGFAPAGAWMAETFAHRYPVALERILRGHTQAVRNPASILISLANDYVHAGWLVKAGSGLMKFGGTHGALDDLNSTGILLSSFAPTQDTTSSRVAAIYDGFPGRLVSRADDQGGEWISGTGLALKSAVHRRPNRGHHQIPTEAVFLHVCTPCFQLCDADAPVEVAVRKIPRYLTGTIRRGDPKPSDALEQHFTLDLPISAPDPSSYERVYAYPPGLILEPQKEYRLSGYIHDQKKAIGTFKFTFLTDARGWPVLY